MVLTNKQIEFLDFLENQDIVKRIFWTGGTSLAYKYNHRLSTDLDFFSFELLSDIEILQFINLVKKYFNVNSVQRQIVQNRNIFLFDKNLDNLKIEIAFFPFENLGKFSLWKKNLRIDSILDIGINKIHAVSERFETKDIFDLYYIFKKEKFSFEQLLELVEKKFGIALNKNDIIARLNFIAKDIVNIKPFLIKEEKLEDITNFYEKFII